MCGEFELDSSFRLNSKDSLFSIHIHKTSSMAQRYLHTSQNAKQRREEAPRVQLRDFRLLASRQQLRKSSALRQIRTAGISTASSRQGQLLQTVSGKPPANRRTEDRTHRIKAAGVSEARRPFQRPNLLSQPRSGAQVFQ